MRIEMEKASEPTIEHSGEGRASLPPKWVTPDDARKIAAELEKLGATYVRFVLTDDAGKHESTDLETLIANIPWTGVKALRLTFEERDGPIVRMARIVVIISDNSAWLSWDAPKENRIIGTRHLFERVRDVITAMPTRPQECAFVLEVPPVAESPAVKPAPPAREVAARVVPASTARGSRWSRPPEGLKEWLEVGVPAVAILGGIVTIVLAVAGAFPF